MVRWFRREAPHWPKVVQDRWPDIKFHTQREHAGLMVDRIPDIA